MSEQAFETTVSRRGVGRPPTYDLEDSVAKICERLSRGETMAEICRTKGLPSADRVAQIAAAQPEIAQAISRARQAGFDKIASDALQIADGKIPHEVGEKADPNRDKLRVETRLKLLAKWDPKRYGDNLQLRHADAEGGKLDTQPLVNDLLTMLNVTPGAAMPPAIIEAQATLIESPRTKPPPARPAAPDAIDDLV